MHFSAAAFRFRNFFIQLITHGYLPSITSDFHVKAKQPNYITISLFDQDHYWLFETEYDQDEKRSAAGLPD